MTRSNFSLYFVMLTALLWRTGVFSAPVPVSGVTMQHIGGTEFKITYSLSTDAIVTLGIEDNSVLQPDTAVANATGDVWRVVNAGSNRTIIWDAGFD